MKKIVELCTEHLLKYYNIDISDLERSATIAYEKTHYLFFPKKRVIDYISDYKDKKDIRLISDMNLLNIKDLTISSNGKSDFRLNHKIRHYQLFGNEEINDFKGIFNNLLYTSSKNSAARTTQIMWNYFLDESYTSIFLRTPNREDFKNKGFNIIKQITISEPIKNYSRVHFIEIGNKEGCISLRFAGRNKKRCYYFDDDLKIKDILIKDLIEPLMVISEITDEKAHSILEIRIPFKFTDENSIFFEEASMRLFRGMTGFQLPVSNPLIPLSHDASYKTKEFRAIFNSLNRNTKKEIKKPTSLEELVGIIEYWKLLNY